MLEGDTLDGPKIVALTGKSVGLVVATNQITVAGNALDLPPEISAIQNWSSLVID